MTTDEARERLRQIERSTANPGYTEPLSDLEIAGWLLFLQALGLVKDET